MKRIALIITTTLFALNAFAQEATAVQKTFWDDPFNDPMLPVYLVAACVLVVVVLVGLVAIYLIRILNMLTVQAEKEKAQKLGVTYVLKPSWWERLVEQMNASVPVGEEKSIELDHSYDGIKELDNHLPPWWKWLFYGTIGWAALYIVVFHFSNSLPLQEQEYQHELALAEEQARKLKASQPVAEIDENALVFAPDPAIIEKGKSVFLNNNCASCHRPDGGGNTIGPNLTDEYWLHGGAVKEVFHTIKNGVVEKGMPAWGKAMSPQDVRDVTFFIMSLQGSSPANAKAPQGERVNSIPAADSVKIQASL
jgi:cytochrome c oxidase cbb3-type subunit 3